MEPTVHARIDGIAAEDGSLKGKTVRIAVIDTTERKRLEEELGKRRMSWTRKFRREPQSYPRQKRISK